MPVIAVALAITWGTGSTNAGENTFPKPPGGLPGLIQPFADAGPSIAAWREAENLSNQDRRRERPDIQEKIEPLLRRAMEVPLTPAECEEYRRELQSLSNMMQPVRSDELIRQMFFVEVADSLNDTLLALKRNDEAQKLMESTWEFRKKHELRDVMLRDNFLLAGTTERASGGRTIEKEIKSGELIEGNDPEYWVKRDEYYRGRNDNAERIVALKRALALYASPEYLEKPPYRYSDIYGNLFSLLVQEKRYDEAIALFRKQEDVMKGRFSGYLWVIYNDSRPGMEEMNQLDLFNAKFADFLHADMEWTRNVLQTSSGKWSDEDIRGLRGTALRVQHTIDPKDPIFWELMELTTDAFSNERALERALFPDPLYGYHPPEVRAQWKLDEDMLRKAEQLTKKDNSNGDFVWKIGEVLLNNGKPELALPFLEAVLTKKTDRWRGRSFLYENLVSAYLETGKWRQAESLMMEKWDEFNGGFGLPQHLKKAAELAEKEGDHEAGKRLRQRLDSLGVK